LLAHEKAISARTLMINSDHGKASVNRTKLVPSFQL